MQHEEVRLRVVGHQVEGGGDPLSQLVNITNLVKCSGSVSCDDVIRCVFVHLKKSSNNY